MVDGRVALRAWAPEKKEAARAKSPAARSKSPAARAKSPAPEKYKPPTRAKSPGATRARPQKAAPQLEQNEQLYTDLHAKISSRSFNSKVSHSLTTLRETVENECCLNIDSVAKGGSVGRGTAIT